MTRPSLWRVLVPAAVVLALAGTAAALLVTGRHEVTTSSDEAYKVYQRGRENERKLYNREAMADYAEALAHDPEFVMATVRLARSVAGRDRGRAKALLSCAAERRDSVTARERLLFDIANAQINQKELKEIVALVDQYRREYPDDPEGYELRANYFLRQGKADEAAREFELLLERNPNYAIAYNHLGYNAMQRKEYDRAEDYLKRYRFLAPDQANPYDSLGELYANTGRYEEAIASLNKALEKKPDFWASLAHLGTVYTAMGKWREAAEQYRKAAEQTSEKEGEEFLLAEAVSFAVAGDWEAASPRLAALEAARAAEVGPSPEGKRAAGGLMRLLSIRALCLLQAGRLDEVAEVSARVRELEASATDEWKEGTKEGAKEAAKPQDLVETLLKAARGEPEALSSLKPEGGVLPPLTARAGSGWDYFPYRPLVWVFSARVLAEHGHVGEAADVLKGVLAVNPRFAPAVEALAAIRGEDAAASLGAPGSAPHGGR